MRGTSIDAPRIFHFLLDNNGTVQTIDIYSEITFTTEPSLFLTMFTPL